jgi:2-hydroxycyclohexanecarboxyl-CoA dehydrogenase
MDLRISGHTAVVVGSAQGIGKAIARAFATEGVQVVLLDRDAAVAETARELAGLPIVVDVANLDGLREAAERIEREKGRIDHVVFSVGVGSGKIGFPFWNLHPSDWSHVLQVNLLGAVHTAHAFTPALIRASRAGALSTLLFLGSVAGQIGSQTDPPYSASKAALINFSQCAARDLAPHGVRVNTLNPGVVRTELMASIYRAWLAQQPPDRRLTFEDWSQKKIEQVVPLARWQEPEDVAAMAVFLSSPCAGQVVGQTINVDGGYVMHW